MGCAVHLWTGFVSVICYGTFLPTLPGFTPHHRVMTHAGVSGEAFQGVTLSFHLSNYQFTELLPLDYLPVKLGEAVNGNTILKIIDFIFYFAF